MGLTEIIQKIIKKPIVGKQLKIPEECKPIKRRRRLTHWSPDYYCPYYNLECKYLDREICKEGYFMCKKYTLNL